MKSKNLKVGISFIAVDAHSDMITLLEQNDGFSSIKKYEAKCKEWVGLGWDINSENLIDSAIFLSFDWHEDAEIDKIVKNSLKPV